MKIYNLKDTAQNRQEYEKFLKQYDRFKNLNKIPENIQIWLDANKYRLNIVWEVEKGETENFIETNKQIFEEVAKVETKEVKKESKPKRNYKKSKK